METMPFITSLIRVGEKNCRADHHPPLILLCDWMWNDNCISVAMHCIDILFRWTGIPIFL